MQRIKIDIETHTIIRVIGAIVIFWIGIQAILQIRFALVLLLISFFLALALNPPVSYLASKIPGGSRGAATAISYLAVLGIVGIFLYSAVPPLVSSTRDLINTVPQQVQDFQSGSNNGFIARQIEKYHLEDEAQQLASNLTDKLGDIQGPIISGIGRVTTTVAAFITVLVLTFFMLVEGPQWLELFWAYHPAKHREHNKELAKRMYGVVTGYVNGQLLIASIAGLASLVMMVIVGVPNALALAGIVMLTGLIPLIGASLGAIIIVLASLFKSLAAGIIMLIFFLVYQQIENNSIQPYVQSRTLEISPLLVLVAVIIGIQFGGLLGGFLAIPTAACLRILVLDAIKQRNAKTNTGTKAASST